MSNVLQFPPAKADNHVFHTVEQVSASGVGFAAFGDDDEGGVDISFHDFPDERGLRKVRDSVWLSPAQCREFGEALIRAADRADALT